MCLPACLPEGDGNRSSRASEDDVKEQSGSHGSVQTFRLASEEDIKRAVRVIYKLAYQRNDDDDEEAARERRRRARQERLRQREEDDVSGTEKPEVNDQN
ncbi:UNVERIFIED_CONTAM: hypothetical protein K2H54_075195, partial [Gekko kuhli]